MKKISISRLLKTKRKVKIIAGLVTLALIASIVQWGILRNPRISKASVIGGHLDSVYLNETYCTATIQDNVLDAWAFGNGDICNHGYIGVDITNADITIDGTDAVFTIWGSNNHFKSLTLQNGGVLTHGAMAGDGKNDPGDGYDDFRKVDFTLTGDLVLTSGGKIDVAGKGYAGGKLNDGDSCLDSTIPYAGKGPGGGNSANNNADYGEYAGGAGFGANGVNQGANYCDGNDCKGSAYALYATDNDTSTIRPGSGGGAAHAYKADKRRDCAEGGDGGGRIRLVVQGKIKVQTLDSYISADGTDGRETSDKDLAGRAHSGGGSGGGIYIEAGDFEFPNDRQNQMGVPAGNDNDSAKGSVDLSNYNPITTLSSNNYYVFRAAGGKSASGAGSDGAGGRIKLNKTGSSGGISVKKTLNAVYRAGADNDGKRFNPYALQIGDRIEVDLVISGLTSRVPITVVDDYLASSSPSKLCHPKSPDSFFDPNYHVENLGYGHGSGTSNWADPNKLTLTFTPDANWKSTDQFIFNYGCTVE